MLALSFLLLIGVTLIADGFGFHIDKAYIYAAMGFSVFVEALNLRARKRRQPPVELRPTFVKEEAGRPPSASEAARSASPTSGGTHRRRAPRRRCPSRRGSRCRPVATRPSARRDLADREDRGRVERAVVDLQPAQAGVRELAHDVDLRRRLAEMGQDREPAGGPDRRDRLDRPEAAARHVPRHPPAESRRNASSTLVA